MRLKSVQLSGFKSFVDKTTVDFPSNFSAIVGPNGCGKSNVVDAVRLVIGESQARHLRSDTLADVIFNGTSSRAPAGQASIELVFENEDGKLGGEFASYAEISIRREIFRDTESRYWLNNRRCRRRDVQDLFHGTGLGPRGYAIIEQGLISRLIEARPDELRAHIEEAAGISKYRERRRETERNLRATEANLERVRDHAAELDRQIHRLRRQANEVKRFNQQKERERGLQATLIAGELGEANTRLEQHDKSIADANIRLQRVNADLQRGRAELVELRDQETKANDLVTEIQGEYYETRSEIAQIEQSIADREIQIKDMDDDLKSVMSRRDAATKEIDSDAESVQELQTELVRLRTEREELQQSVAGVESLLSQSKAAVDEWQARWNEVDAEHRNARIDSKELSLELEDAELREKVLLGDLARLEQEKPPEKSVDGDIDALQEQFGGLERSYKQLSAELDDTAASLSEYEIAFANESRILAQLKNESLVVRDKLTASVAQREQLVGRKSAESEQETWVKRERLDDATRLGEQLDIEAGWELAVEQVLSHHLDAIQVNRLSDYEHALEDVSDEQFALFEPAENSMSSEDSASLSTKLNGDLTRYAPFIEGIFVVESVAEAMAMRADLQTGESVVTKDGVWVSAHWVRVDRSRSADQSTVERNRQIDALEEEMAALDSQARIQEAKVQRAQEQLDELKEHRENLQTQINDVSRNLSSSQLELRTRELHVEQARETAIRVENTRADLLLRHREIQTQKQALLERKPKVEETKHRWETRLELLTEQRDKNQNELNQALENSQRINDRARQLDVQISKAIANRDAIQKSSERLRQSLGDLDVRQASLRESLVKLRSTLPELEQDRDQKLQGFASVESRLADAQNERNELSNEIRTTTGEIYKVEQQSASAQETLTSLREQRAQLVAQQEQLTSDIERLGVEQEVIVEFAAEFTTEQLESRLLRTTRRIERMGAINMAAIQDLENVEEEKRLIDQQIEDIEKAQSNLSTTIRELDRKTVAMFTDTFEEIDGNLRRLFRRVFRGGTAGLELVEPEDVLNTGVVIKATPPGKKNKSINLLSGGEKALTAIALVFAIFELNPSPVCLLDEVDAPLDELNIVRFCELLDEMTRDVQFVVISHNVHTVSCADHLIGVSMEEAGISRIVTVVLKQAKDGLSANAAG